MLTLMWLAAIGQTLFVAIWVTMPWHRHWIGRALMTKSAALCLTLWFWVASFYEPTYPGRDQLRAVLVGLVCVGIWLQVFAIVEALRNSRDRDKVLSRD